MSDERDERVRQRAYDIWEREGQPSGRERDHWDQARREIDQEEQGRTAPKAPAGGGNEAPKKAVGKPRKASEAGAAKTKKKG